MTNNECDHDKDSEGPHAYICRKCGECITPGLDKVEFKSLTEVLEELRLFYKKAYKKAIASGKKEDWDYHVNLILQRPERKCD